MTVLADDARGGGAYRMYYRGLPQAGADGSAAEVTCVALGCTRDERVPPVRTRDERVPPVRTRDERVPRSPDGVAWTRPDLGLFEVAGTRQNNVVLAGAAPFSHNFSPFIDARPDCPPAERYKAIAGTSASGLAGFVSADGLRWRKIRDVPLITKGAFDSQNVAFWSEAEGCYACYFRIFDVGFRSIARATSPDFLAWSEPVARLYAG